jgi:hypothetical protein
MAAEETAAQLPLHRRLPAAAGLHRSAESGVEVAGRRPGAPAYRDVEVG